MMDDTTATERVDGVATEAHEPFLVVVMLGNTPQLGGSRHALVGAKEVILGRGARSEAKRIADRLELTFDDPWLSSRHARIFWDGAAYVLEDLGSKNGTFIDEERIERVVLPRGVTFGVGRTFLRIVEYPATPKRDWYPLNEVSPAFATMDPSLATTFQDAVRVGANGVPILLRGETGVGKEIVARALHAESKRSGPFVGVNCGAFAPNLFASQLFGHVKGAFSDAVRDEPGLIRAAHGGTLLLDEIGDLPIECQPALLRVLQEREVLPIGGTRPVKVDVRILSATHKPIEATPSFRADLRARLSGLSIDLPNVGQRRNDIGLFIATILRDLEATPVFTARAGRAILGHAWPLNVRELHNVLSVAVSRCKDGVIDVEHLSRELQTVSSVAPPREPAWSDDEENLRAHLIAKLREHAGNVSEVARSFGRARMQVQRWIKRFGIDPESFRK